jgi:1-acyl-sn-glycerol-3-phosphate acyltransferase
MLRTAAAAVRTLVLAPLFFIYTLFVSAEANRIARRGEGGAAIDPIARRWAHRFIQVPPIDLTVEGLENIDLTEQYIMVSNHQSNLDIPVAVHALPLATRFISKQEVARIPIFGRAAQEAGVVMVNRESVRSGHEALNQAIGKSMDEGNSILIFAEGTRSRTGEIGTFRKGAARIALATGKDILPIVIHGTYALNPPGSPIIYPGEVTVRVLPPLSTDGMTTQQVPAVTDELRRQIAENYDELADRQHQS